MDWPNFTLAIFMLILFGYTARCIVKAPPVSKEDVGNG